MEQPNLTIASATCILQYLDPNRDEFGTFLNSQGHLRQPSC